MMPVKKKAPAKKSAHRRSPKLVRPKDSIFDSQMGYFLLMGAALAILVSFHYAQDRLTPAKSLVQASSAAAGLGR